MDNFLLKLSIMLVPGLMAITCHEVSHGYIADRFGDKTARLMGRLTLNPLKHLDILGTIMVFVIGIGWAKPVPVNFNNLRHPKRDMIWVAAAGPITNFLLASLSALLMRGILAVTASVPNASWLQLFIDPLILMLAFSIYINLLLATFNLIPIPPLDGGRVAVGLLPYRQANALSRLEPFGMLIIIGLVFFVDQFYIFISQIVNGGILLLAGPQSKLVFSVQHFLMR
jgi:Zn-dependent protease